MDCGNSSTFEYHLGIGGANEISLTIFNEFLDRMA
jgi:hypothetical protein